MHRLYTNCSFISDVCFKDMLREKREEHFIHKKDIQVSADKSKMIPMNISITMLTPGTNFHPHLHAAGQFECLFSPSRHWAAVLPSSASRDTYTTPKKNLKIDYLS